MTTLTVTTGGKSYSYDASPEQIAGLGALVASINAKVPQKNIGTEEEPNWVAGDPTYATDLALLQDSISGWLAGNPTATDAEVTATMERALDSWAGLPAPEAPVAAEMSPEAKTAMLIAYAAEKRWQVEIAGTTWNGHGVHTDRESQTKLLAAFVAIGTGLRQDPSPWKFKDGFQDLSNAQMSEVILASLAHVNAAFAVEKALVAEVEAGNITDKSAIDAAQWPA